ncbi:MAG: hypothetical protein KIS94_09230 [Chitinophagales bacterium]|nr:hypothetical protein [Chitinophagales bacterium]
MTKPWKYIDNQFLIATRTSYKRAVKLSNYHDAALLQAVATDPAFQPVYDRYHPLHLALEEQWSIWKSRGGAQEGETLNLNQLLEQAENRLPGWEVQIQVVYPATTPRYKAIFPDGRKPFTKGTIDQRINAYNILSLNIGADPALATIKTVVDDTYTGLNNARIAQQGAKAVTKAGSEMLEAAVTDAMITQYRNMGFLMDNFYEQRESLANTLFDLQTLRDLDQRIFTGTLSPLETEPVLVHTFLSDDRLRLKNNGSRSYTLYLASTPSGINSTPVIVAPLEEKNITAADFEITNYGTHRYLTAVNPNNDAETEYLIELY